MLDRRQRLLAIIALMLSFGLSNAWAGDLKLTLPKRSQLTLVQRLNRDGVTPCGSTSTKRPKLCFTRHIFSILATLLR